jgi:hypothetical protein
MWLDKQKARTDSITSGNGGQYIAQYFTSIVKLWIFADRRNTPLLMNEMVNVLHQSVVMAWTLPNNVIREVYEDTAEGSALRRMLAHAYECIGSLTQADAIAKQPLTIPRDFVIDLVKRLIEPAPRKRLMKEEYQKIAMCPSFHVHEEGVTCTSKVTV